jgi:hypothetical protein
MSLDEWRGIDIDSLDEEQLSGKRLELLSIIERVSNNLELGNEERARQLQSHKRCYNMIMDRLNAINEPPRFDPLDKLPVEICQTIFHEALPFNFPPDLIRTYPNEILAYILVSKRWLNFLVNMPLFWTNISFDDRTPDCLARAKMNLVLSKGMSIHLNVSFPITWWVEALPFLAENRHRITSMCIDINFERISDYTGIYKEIGTYLSDFLPLPNLQQIRFYDMEASAETTSLVRRVLDECPSLTSIDSFSLTRDILQLDSALRLRSFYTTRSLLGLVQERFPKLDNIAFSETWGPSGYLNDSPNPASSPDHLLAWSRLYFESWGDKYPPLGLISRLTGLVTFTSAVNGPILKELLCQLHLMVRLSQLTLKIYEEQYETELPSDTQIRPCESATALDITFETLLTRAPQEITSDREKYLSRIQEVFLKALPSVEELKLFSPNLFPIHFLDSRTFPRLVSVSLTHIARPSMDIILSPSIENLHFRVPYQELFGLPKYSSSSLQRLFAESWEYSNVSGNMDSKRCPDPDKWPALISLNIPARHFSQNVIGFTSLRTLVLRCTTDLHGQPDTTDDHITRFCRNFAMNPSELPALENLCLYQLPEWDIFFIMMDKRNVMKTQEVSKLKNIKLPNWYPKELLWPICELIRGKFATRPSNWDLSFAGNLELLEDVTM